MLHLKSCIEQTQGTSDTGIDGLEDIDDDGIGIADNSERKTKS